MRQFLLLAASVVLASLFVPSVFAGTPNGTGLYGEHQSHCTGAFSYDGLVTLVPGNGNSFWADGHHLVIQSATVTPTGGGDPITYTFGQKAGQLSGDIVTCEGDFPGYHVVSHDVVVP